MRKQTAVTSEAAEMKISHLVQIEAVLAVDMRCRERIEMFARAIDASDAWIAGVVNAIGDRNWAMPYWFWGDTANYPKSIFADLPGCQCPVMESRYKGMNYKLIPSRLPPNWQPSREVLEEFSKVQLTARGY